MAFAPERHGQSSLQGNCVTSLHPEGENKKALSQKRKLMKTNIFQSIPPVIIGLHGRALCIASYEKCAYAFHIIAKLCIQCGKLFGRQPPRKAWLAIMVILPALHPQKSDAKPVDEDKKAKKGQKKVTKKR